MADEVGDAVPGTGGEQSGQQPQPPAGESNADTEATGPPEAIPYARFKEVNDELGSLRGYGQLRDWGYDPDSLGRLAQFEAAYIQDPTGVWLQLADNLDLPQEVVDALAKVPGVDASSDDLGLGEPSGSAQGEPSADGTSSRSPELEYLIERERTRERVEREYADQQTELAEQQAADGMLQEVLGHWKQLDTADGLETPEEVMLTYITAHGGRGGYSTPQGLAEAARQSALGYRETVLGGAVRSRQSTGSPLTVPGSASAASPAQEFGGDIKAATRAARAAIERGDLPGA